MLSSLWKFCTVSEKLQLSPFYLQVSRNCRLWTSFFKSLIFITIVHEKQVIIVLGELYWKRIGKTGTYYITWLVKCLWTVVCTWCHLQRPLCFPQLLDSLQELSASGLLQGIAWKHCTAAGEHKTGWLQEGGRLVQKKLNKHKHVFLTHSVFEVHLCVCWVNYPLYLYCSNFADFTLC